MPNKHQPITTHADPETRPHAEHSPSGLKNFAACPSYGSRGGTNPMAESGTRIHVAIEKRNPQLLLDGEEQALATTCLDFLDNIRGARASSADLVASHQEILLEVSLSEHSTYGTCDLLDVYSDGDATLMDWKTGYGSVDDAEHNLQGWCYVLGAFQRFPDIKRIQLYFVLPRRHEVSLAEFTRGDIPRLSLGISTVIARAKELRGVEFNPAEGVCDYCKFQGSCKALAGKALAIAHKSGFEVPNNIAWDSSAEEKAKLLKLANLMADWADATKKEMLRQALEEGVELPGYRLDSRKTPRTIESPLLGFAAVSDMITFEEFLSACTRVSVVELEKIVAEKADRGQKGNARMALECKLRDKGALKDEGVIHILKPVRK